MEINNKWRTEASVFEKRKKKKHMQQDRIKYRIIISLEEKTIW